MWFGLLSLAIASPLSFVVDDVSHDITVTADGTSPELQLLADGTVVLSRQIRVVIEPPPEPVEGEEVVEDPDTDSDSGEPEPHRIAVLLSQSEDPSAVLTVASETAVVRSYHLHQHSVDREDSRGELAAIDVHRVRLRTEIEAAETILKRGDATARPDLDLLERQLGLSTEPVEAELRDQAHIAHLQAELERHTVGATLILDSAPAFDQYLEVVVEPLEPGEYILTITRPVPDATWASGYMLDASPESGVVVSTWLGGLNLPQNTAFDDVAVSVDWGNGLVTVVPSMSFHPDGGAQPFVIAQLPNVYRNIVGDRVVNRRVDVSNPFDSALPATLVALGMSIVPIGALEPEASFRLSLGPAQGFRVRQRDSEFDIRTGIEAITPVWLPIDPTGCRIAASGQIIGMEELDGEIGIAVGITERGVVSVLCD